MPPTLCHETPAEGYTPALRQKKPVPFRFRRKPKAPYPQAPSSFPIPTRDAGLGIGWGFPPAEPLKPAGGDKTVWNVPENVTPLPGFTHPGAWLNLPQKLPDADKGGSPAQDRTWGSAGAGGARPSAAGGRDTGP